MKNAHKVWRITIGSADDERLKDRFIEGGKRLCLVFKLPVRAEYLVEGKGQGTRAEKKAIKLAQEDGIARPVILGTELMNHPGRAPGQQ